MIALALAALIAQPTSAAIVRALERGAFMEARLDIDRALESASNDTRPELLLLLGIACAGSGAHVEAVQAWTRAIQLARTTLPEPFAQNATFAEPFACARELAAQNSTKEAIRARLLGPEPCPRPPPPTPLVPPAPLTEPGPSTAKYVVLSSGAVLTVAGAIVGAVALATRGELDDAKDRGASPIVLTEATDRGRAEALTADVLVGTGVVTLLVGWLWVE